MGDSAFLVMTSDFKAYIILTIISFVVALITGYLVDYFNIEQRLELHKCKRDKNAIKKVEN